MPGERIVQDEAAYARVDGERLVCFAGCNYLGLAHEPRVREAVIAAAGEYGVSTSASRETSGNTPIHEALEAAVADFISCGRGDGLLLPDGYTANLAALQGLEETHSFAVVDSRAHRSLFDAARLAGLPVVTYPHRDVDALAGLLADLRGRAAVLTDGVFAADGAVAPLVGVLGVLRPGDVLLVDDCHGFCVLGDGGRGTCDALGIRLDGRVVVTTTLAKGLGCGGGVVVGEGTLIERIRARSTAYICTTPTSPLVASAGLAAIGLVRDEPGRVSRLQWNAVLLGDACGVDKADGRATPISAFTPPTGVSGPAMAGVLRRSGVYVPWVRYPGGPGAVYFRASVTSAHTAEQIELLGDAIRRGGVVGCRA